MQFNKGEKMETFYAIIQSGYAIFGSGKTKEEAYEDAQQWTEDLPSLKDVEGSQGNSGDIILVECTKFFHNKFQEHGTFTYDVNEEGLYCAEEELEKSS